MLRRWRVPKTVQWIVKLFLVYLFIFTAFRIATVIFFKPKSIGLCGGVAANKELRRQVTSLAERFGLPILIPSKELCTDNAAMIGLAASHRLAMGEASDFSLEVEPNSRLFMS